MIPKYIATLALVVFLLTFAASSLQFATRSQVLSGKAVDETLNLEFTIDEDRTHTYEVNSNIQQFLQDRIGFYTEGPAHVVSSKVEITPKDVSWTESHTTYTSPGAAMTAQIQWDTPADSANGAHGSIYLKFPDVPGLEGKAATFHSGAFQMDGQRRCVIREMTTYWDTFRLSVARYMFALTAGLPFGIVLHTIFWAFVLKGEKRSRLEALPPQGAGLPRTFYPDPIAEWVTWLIVLGIGASVASLMAGLSMSEGFMSSDFVSIVYIILGIAAAIALIVIYFTGKSVLTVRIETDGISYARGRGDLQWLNAAWSGILRVTHKSRTYRGNTSYWTEVEFKDNRKKLKIGQSIGGYPALRTTLTSSFPS